MMKKILYAQLLLVCFCIGCTSNTKTEKHQDKRDKVTNVHNKIKELKIEDVIIGSIAPINLLNDYLIIGDVMTQENLLHLFDRNNFRYIKSALAKGEGPLEITNVGYIGVNESKNMIYISDHGKQKIFAYELDSILNNPQYAPQVLHEMDGGQFPNKYQYVNDTSFVASIIEPTGNSGYNQSIAQWNPTTGKMRKMSYEHPDIEKKRINFAVSSKHNMIAECYTHNDLMTIYDLNGNLKCNIYGPNWAKGSTNKNTYYEGVVFCNDKILTLYSGEETFDTNKKVNRPTKLLVFDLNGDYIQTLETQYQITYICYDEKNDRIIMSLDDEIQFAYLDLKELD